MSNKLAIVLFVKDEAFDLPGWIAWYATSGFDTLVIYEDSSSDLTAEVIDAAAQFYDIRRRAVPESYYFQHRQQAVYMHAAETLRDEFEWVGFLDADEYIWLPNNDDAHDFFSKFDESVGAVAFNWCCYGSGWHILRPGPNVPEQFEHRSPREFFENLTVKSFVRIKQMRLEYADPHRFFVEGRIVEPSGRDVVWSDTQRHHTAEAPDWGHGAVLHYAVRSAEHYIEKVKRRSDIRTATDIQFFAWWDKNDDHVPLPKSRLEKMNDILFMIQYGIAQSRVAYLSKLEPVATGDERPVYEAFFLSTYFGGVLCADAATGTLTSADEHQDAGASRTPVILFLPQDLKNPAFLVAADPEGTPIYIYGESQVSHCIPFKATRVSETQVVLQSVTRKLFMTCFDHRSTAASEYRVKILAAWAKEWENLTLLPLPDALAHDPRIAAWKGILSGGLSLSRFKGADSDFAAWPDFFAALLATKPERERTTFLAKNDLDELPWIGRMAAISF